MQLLLMLNSLHRRLNHSIKAFGTGIMLLSSNGAALIWTVVVYQLMVSSNAQNNGPGYLGCFRDGDLGRSLSLQGDSTTSVSLSLEWCFKYCLRFQAYKYAGMSSGTTCQCGNNEDYRRYGSAQESNCRYTCPGNSNQFCGGLWQNAIYQISKGVCDNGAIVSPVHGNHRVTDPTNLFFNLNNFKFVGTRVTFGCDTGYVIQGTDAIECIQRGDIAEWSHSVPTCRPTAVRLTTISNTAQSLLPMTISQFYTSLATTTSRTKVTPSSGVPSSITDETDGSKMTNPPTFQTGTIIGIAAGVIASLMILLVIVMIIFRKRQKSRAEGINGATGTVRADVTPGSGYEIPSPPGAVNPNPLVYDVITDSTYEMPSPTGAVNPDQKESDVTTSMMSSYEIPRPPTNNNHQFTLKQPSNDVVHEYADTKLTSQI